MEPFEKIIADVEKQKKEIEERLIGLESLTQKVSDMALLKIREKKNIKNYSVSRMGDNSIQIHFENESDQIEFYNNCK